MNIDHKKPENRPLYIFALIAVGVILFLNCGEDRLQHISQQCRAWKCIQGRGAGRLYLLCSQKERRGRGVQDCTYG